MNNQKKYKQTNNVELPKVGYTPMDTIEMEVALYKNMGDLNKKRSLLLKIAIIFFSLIILITPSITLIYLSILAILENFFSNLLISLLCMMGLLFGLLFFLIGVKIIYFNIKK